MTDNETFEQNFRKSLEDIANEIVRLYHDSNLYVHEDEDDDNSEEYYYFDENYNLDYIWRDRYGLMGVRVMIAYGGPNIWVDSFNQEIIGYWGASEIHVPLPSDVCYSITNHYEEYIDYLIDDIRACR